MKYRIALDDGTIVAETLEEGVEFYVKDGNTFWIINCMPIHGDLELTFWFLSGHLCPALQKAIVTMKRGEKAKLVVQPQCMSLFLVINKLC